MEEKLKNSKSIQSLDFLDKINLMTSEDVDFSTDADEMKLAKKIVKNNKKNKLKKEAKNEEFVENVIYYRKRAKKLSQVKDKENSRRIRRCNKEILSKDPDFKEIYLTIDEFNNNGKKTIAYFIDSFFPVIDGVVAVLDNYAKYMQKYYNVVICAPKHKNTCYKTDKYFVLQSDAIYVKSQGYDLAFPQLDPIFLKYISLLKIDLVHIQAPFNMGSFGLTLAKKRKIPSFSTFHSQFKQNFYNAVKSEVVAQWLTSIVMNVYKKTTYTLTMNTFARDIMKEYGLKKDVEIVPNATNLKEKDFNPEYENEILKKHGIDKNKFNMIYIGRFVEVKNVYFIIDVITEVYKKNPNFNFIFLGFGPEQSKMQRLIKKNGLEKIVKFTGKIDSVDEKAVIIKNSSLLFFPSVYDTDGIVKIECACYSVPTLTIEGTGVACNMKDNHNGFIEKYDKQAFVKRIEFLLKNVDFVKKVGKNAKTDLYITWEGACEILNEIYKKALNTKLLKSKNNSNKNSKKSLKNRK